MNKTRIKNISIFIFLLLLMHYFSYIPIYIFKIDMSKLSDTLKIVYLLSCDILYMLIVYIFFYRTINNDFKKYFKDFDKNYRTSIQYYIIGYILMVVSNIIISLFFRNATAGNEEIVRSLIDDYPLYMFFSVSIYAPFVEELVFRKSIYDIVYSFKENKYTKYIYIITSGLIFSLMHVLGVSDNLIDYIYVIPYLCLGIAFAALYHKTKNIFSTIMMHSLHNTIAILGHFKGGQ